MSLQQLIETALNYDWRGSCECAGLQSSSQQLRHITLQLVALNSEGVGDLNTSIGPPLELTLPQPGIEQPEQFNGDQNRPNQAPQRVCQPSSAVPIHLAAAPSTSEDQLEQRLEEERQATAEQNQAQEALDAIISQYLQWEARVTCFEDNGERIHQAHVQVGKVRHWSLFQLESENPRFQLGLTFAEPIIAIKDGGCSARRMCNVQVNVRIPGDDSQFAVLNHTVSLDPSSLAHHKTEEYAETEVTIVRKIFIGSKKQCTLTLSHTQTPSFRPSTRSAGLTIQLPDTSPGLTEIFDEASFHTPVGAETSQISHDDLDVSLHSANAESNPPAPTPSAPSTSPPPERIPEWQFRDISYHLSVADLGRCLGDLRKTIATGLSWVSYHEAKPDISAKVLWE